MAGSTAVVESSSGVVSKFLDSHWALVEEAARGGRLLDLACGRGRHAVAAARRGLRVVALDRNREYLDELIKIPIEGPGSIDVFEFDLEAGIPPPAALSEFSVIVVSRYLFRPLMPWIESALASGGLLIYETFTRAQRQLGWGPKRDAFLLNPGELPTLFPQLETLIYEEGLSGDDPPAQTARLLARRPA